MFLPSLWTFIAWKTDRHRTKGRPEEALRLAQRYTQVRPRDERAWMVLADVLHAHNRLEEEAAALRKGLERNPRSVLIRADLSDALVGLNHMADAKAVLDEAMKLEPSSPRARLGLADWLIAQGRFEEARAAADGVRSRLSNVDDPWNIESRLSRIYLMLPSGERIARELLESAAASARRGWWEHSRLAVLLREKDPEAADRHLRKARKSWRGNEEEFLQELERAREGIEQARSLHPYSE